jgi:hypothetical protein
MAAKGSRVAAKVSDCPGFTRGQATSFQLRIHHAQSLRIPGPAFFTQNRLPKIDNPVFSTRIAVTLFNAGTRRFLSRTWTSENLATIDSPPATQKFINSTVDPPTAIRHLALPMTLSVNVFMPKRSVCALGGPEPYPQP